MPRSTTTHHDPPLSKTYPPPPTTTHHHPQLPTTSQNMSTTTHHHPPPSISTHHQPKYVHHHPLPPTTSQNISTTTHYHPKHIHHYLPFPKKWTTTPQKSKYIHIWPPLDIALTVSFSSKCNIPFRDGDFFVIKFWSVRFSNSKFLLHSILFTVFKIF